MFTCFDLSLFLLADTSSPALENKLSAGRVTCHVKYRYKPILILSIDTSSSDAGIGNIDILASVSPITTMQLVLWGDCA